MKRIKAETMTATSFASVPKDGSIFDICPVDITYFVLPTDAESYERMVEQMAKAMLLTWNAGTRQYECVKDAARISAHAALKSIGVVPPRTGRGRKGTK